MERTPTPKQLKLLHLLSENLRTRGSTRTLGQLIREAGYSKSMSESPSLVLSSLAVQGHIKGILGQMDDIRYRALAHITDEKLKKASAKENAGILDTMTKNIQLLSGKKTENRAINIEISEMLAEKNQS